VIEKGGIKMNEIWEWFKTLEPNNQIQIISALVLVVTAMILVLTAIFTFISARATKKTSLAQTLMRLMDDYSSPEMQESLVGIIKFRDEHGEEYFVNEFAAMEKANPLCDINRHRRKYSYFFHKIIQLLDHKLVNENFVKKLVKREMVRYLLEIVEPMLKEADPKYDRRTFDTFRKLYDKLK
jgi:hypothetical protein